MSGPGNAPVRDAQMDVVSQYLIATVDGRLWHAIRQSDGTWSPLQQPAIFYRIVGIPAPLIPANHLAGTQLTASTADFAITMNDGSLWHVQRDASGNWVPSPSDSVSAEVGIPNPVGQIAACVADAFTENYILNTVDGRLWHTRRVSITQPAWTALENLTMTFNIGAVGMPAAAGAGGAAAQYLIVTGDNQLFHVMRQPDGTWGPLLNVRQELLQNPARKDPGPISLAQGACSAFDSGSSLIQTQWLVLTTTGHLWHLQRQFQGFWSALDVTSDLGFSAPASGQYYTAMGGAGNGNVGQAFFAFTTPDGQLWHTTFTGSDPTMPLNLTQTLGIPAAVHDVAVTTPPIGVTAQ